MKIYELEGDVHFLRITYDKELTELVKHERGKRMGELWGKVSLNSMKGVVKKSVPLGDCPYFAAVILIVSEKLKGLIQAFTDDELEFLPVDIDGQPGYSYMNVLCILDALDLKKTELKRFDSGKIMYVIQAQYHDEIVNGHHIFMLPNYHGIYISEDLKKYLEDNYVHGATYRDTTQRVENPFAEVFAKPKKKKPKRGRLH
ncbi:MAG TPA: DUF1629 domain-containing protein [Acidiferrobacterales bacterium]|nr:DUF1629 domain-containing protein [Acidiferrobacterales bacterium]